MSHFNIPSSKIVDVSASNREAKYCPEDFIKEAERHYHGSVGQLALQARRRGSRILLVAGPSGSGIASLVYGDSGVMSMTCKCSPHTPRK